MTMRLDVAGLPRHAWRPATRAPIGLATWLAAGVWLLVPLAYLVIHQGGYGSLERASWVLALGALSITAMNWVAHHGGRHPSFLFLGLGCLFLAGRAMPVLGGEPSRLDLVSFGQGFNVSHDTVSRFTLLVLVSFFFVHVGSLLSRGSADRAPVPAATASFETRAYLLLFLATLPLYLYKNVYYLRYVMEHGGYLAIYLGSEHIEGVGVLARVGSLLCMSAFTLYVFHETDARRARWAIIFFVLAFSIELLIGLRGKFFAIGIALALTYMLRFGGRFSLRGIGALVLVVVGLSLFVEIFREQKDKALTSGTLEIFFDFIAQQGVTAGVVQVVMEDIERYARHAGGYALRQFVVPFLSQQDVPPGWSLANDVSMELQPEAYLLGFGTGSSYLAELLLIGGWLGVMVGSLAIGVILGGLSRLRQGTLGALSFCVVSAVIYYPRTMLQDPGHNLMRYGPPILLLVAIVAAAKGLLVPARRARA